MSDWAKNVLGPLSFDALVTVILISVEKACDKPLAYGEVFSLQRPTHSGIYLLYHPLSDVNATLVTPGVHVICQFNLHDSRFLRDGVFDDLNDLTRKIRLVKVRLGNICSSVD